MLCGSFWTSNHINHILNLTYSIILQDMFPTSYNQNEPYDEELKPKLAKFNFDGRWQPVQDAWYRKHL